MYKEYANKTKENRLCLIYVENVGESFFPLNVIDVNKWELYLIKIV